MPKLVKSKRSTTSSKPYAAAGRQTRSSTSTSKHSTTLKSKAASASKKPTAAKKSKSTTAPKKSTATSKKSTAAPKKSSAAKSPSQKPKKIPKLTMFAAAAESHSPVQGRKTRNSLSTLPAVIAPGAEGFSFFHTLDTLGERLQAVLPEKTAASKKGAKAKKASKSVADQPIATRSLRSSDQLDPNETLTMPSLQSPKNVSTTPHKASTPKVPVPVSPSHEDKSPAKELETTLIMNQPPIALPVENEDNFDMKDFIHMDDIADDSVQTVQREESFVDSPGSSLDAVGQSQKQDLLR